MSSEFNTKPYNQDDLDAIEEAIKVLSEQLETLRSIARAHGEHHHEAYVLAQLDTVIGEGQFIDTYEDTLNKWLAEAQENFADDESHEDEDESCPTCGAVPGQGLTPDCDDPNGCGYWRKLASGEGVEHDDTNEEDDVFPDTEDKVTPGAEKMCGCCGCASDTITHCPACDEQLCEDCTSKGKHVCPGNEDDEIPGCFGSHQVADIG